MDLNFRFAKEVSMVDIEKLEEQIGVKLPSDYKELLLICNGAYVQPDAFRVNGMVESINNFHSVDKFYEFTDERIPKGIILIARDAGGNQICMDLREDGSNPILFWEPYCGQDESGRISRIANSFGEFINMLFEHNE